MFAKCTHKMTYCELVKALSRGLMHLILIMLGKSFSRRHLEIFIFVFHISPANRLWRVMLRRLFAWNVTVYFLGKMRKIINFSSADLGWRAGGWGGCGNLGALVRVCEPVFQNLPYSYTWPLKKTNPFIYLIIQNVDLFIYCPLIFCTHFCWLLDKYHSQRISSLEKSCAYTRLSEKWGLSHRNPEKNGHSYTFCWKKGANHIPGSAEKGGYSARTSVLCHI